MQKRKTKSFGVFYMFYKLIMLYMCQVILAKNVAQLSLFHCCFQPSLRKRTSDYWVSRRPFYLFSLCIGRQPRYASIPALAQSLYRPAGWRGEGPEGRPPLWMIAWEWGVGSKGRATSASVPAHSVHVSGWLTAGWPEGRNWAWGGEPHLGDVLALCQHRGTLPQVILVSWGHRENTVGLASPRRPKLESTSFFRWQTLSNWGRILSYWS